MKISVPLNIKTLNKTDLPVYLEQIKAVGAERVFICSLSQIACESDPVRKDPEPLRYAISYFKKAGLEVGVWLSTLGHGRALYSDAEGGELSVYQPIVGLDGKSTPYGLCPLGERFINDYTEGLRLVASLGPDLIMLDDDLRFNRGALYYMGCFCRKHLSVYRKKIGEKLSKPEISRLVFAGGENKYRTAFFEMLGESLEYFCKRLRQAVDEVDPEIRMGACSVRESVDYDFAGADRIAEILAGGTKPFLRTSGAPYGGDVIGPAEFTRLQMEAYKSSGAELLTEGDTYPRPRYNLPYNLLRLYDLIICADGKADTRLDYIFDYNHKPEYDPSYAQRYAKDLPLFKSVEAAFSGKAADGVFVYNKIKKLGEWELPEAVDKKLVSRLSMTAENPAANLLSRLSIPTSYEKTDYPAAVLGENARGIDRELLRCGAILDAISAKILSEAGVDVGLASMEKINPQGEYFISEGDTAVDVDGGFSYGMRVKPEAKIHSVYVVSNEKNENINSSSLTDRTPILRENDNNTVHISSKNGDFVASYTYTNADGERFLVLGADLYLSTKFPNFISGFYRERQIKRFIEECGKPLPAAAIGNPNLYIYTARGERSLSVLLVNAFADEIPSPEITLDREYRQIRFVHGSGKLSGNKAYLSEIPPYGFAVFEVSY